MKKLILLLISGFFFVQCKKNDAIEIPEIKSTIDINIERFEKEFVNITPEKIVKLKQKFPELLPTQFSDSFWVAKSKEPLFLELNTEVAKKFPDVKKLETDLELFLSRVKHYFPDEKTPRVLTLVNEVEIDKKAMFTNNNIFISLDSYLGKNHKFYEPFDVYKRANLETNQILPDLVTSFGYRKTINSQDKTLLSEMIYFGKIHYLKDVLIPETPNNEKIGYSDLQYKWCEENEAQMWSYFIDKKLIYVSNVKNNVYFIDDAPFTKFGIEIDKESPGRTGQWIGWQIVKSYMQNNNVTLEELLKTEPIVIFNKSGYKPKK